MFGQNSVEQRRHRLMVPCVMTVAVTFLAAASLCVAQTPPGDCPSAHTVDEGEGCGAQVNAGCDSALPEFTAIGCGDVVCASTWADDGTRDVDWYDVSSLDSNGDVVEQVQFSIVSSVPLLGQVFDGCFGPLIQVQDCTFNGATSEWVMTIEVCDPPLAGFLLKLAPGFRASGAIIDGYPCGADGHPYHFAVSCGNKCDGDFCPECVQTPAGLLAWWPLDESTAATSSADVAGGHTAIHVNTVSSGLEGYVDQSVKLVGTGYLMAIDEPGLNIGPTMDFSVMGWIKIDLGDRSQTLISKYDPGTDTGWRMSLDDSNRLVFSMKDDGGNQVNQTSAGMVPESRWVHVAVSVDRSSPTGVRFYVNGSPSGSADPTGAQGDLSNPHRLYLGGIFVNGSVGELFIGGLDEIMLLPYAIPGDAVARIQSAGCGGTCKTRMHVTRFTPFCDGDSDTVAVVTVFNDRVDNLRVDLNFDGVPFNGHDCELDGPVTFQADTPNPLILKGQSRKNVLVTIHRPQGMQEDGDTACWRAMLSEAATMNATVVRRGYVVQSDSICVEPVDFEEGVQAIPMGEVTPFNFIVHNRTAMPYQLQWAIQAVHSISGNPNEQILLDNGEPGDPVLGMVDVPENGSTTVSVAAEWVYAREESGQSTKGQTLDMVMYEDPGKIEPDQGLGSKGGESTQRSAEDTCQPADINCDGVVDVDDLLLLLASWGECPDPESCPGDIDGNGEVNVDDLLALLAAFGS